MKTRSLHIEWIVFLGGLFLLATMSSENSGSSLCLFEWVGFKYCLGDGLGHSINYFFQGDIKSAIQENFMGPVAVLILSFRIISIWIRLLSNYKENKMGTIHV